MLRTIVQLGNIHFVFRRGISTMDPACSKSSSPKYEMGVTQLYNSSYSPWARQNIGTTQGGKTSMVQNYLLHQYKLRNM